MWWLFGWWRGGRGGWGRGRGGWLGPWPGRGPFSHLPPWMRPGWLYGRGACWWLFGVPGWILRWSYYPTMPLPYYLSPPMPYYPWYPTYPFTPWIAWYRWW